jgi:hypothetical protein
MKTGLTGFWFGGREREKRKRSGWAGSPALRLLAGLI